MALKLRTEIEPGDFPEKITHADPLLSLGSCFSDTIGERLLQARFPVMVNPFGALFHPAAIHRLLRISLGEAWDFEESLAESGGIWHSLDLHSSFSSPDPALVYNMAQTTLMQVQSRLRDARWLLLTWGTARQHVWQKTGLPVANCHKLPAAQFRQRMSDPDEILEDFRRTRELLHAFNPHLRILLTISPVRHTRDTLAVNSLSKSLLRVAAARIQAQLGRIWYFPAYEIMQDDLRDYRFYETDLVHPNALAQEYIWEKFSENLFSINTNALLRKWDMVRRDLEHVPFHPQAPAYRQHLESTMSRMLALRSSLDIEAEIAALERRLQALSQGTI